MKSLFIVILSILCIIDGCAKIEEYQTMASGRHTITAPEFPDGLEWLNVEKPLKLSNLRGKIVLLDFWTFCCINCIHIIPDLKKLEAKYPKELVVIGVHSAKFSSEKETDNIRQAVLRYELKHPVVNDKDFKIWNSYVAKAWPTIVLISPLGKIAGYRSGEGIYDDMDKAIKELIEKYSDEIDRTPVKLSLEKDKKPKSLLNFPGKVTADEKSGILIISDSNNNRIIISDFDGNIIDVIGSGKQGRKDSSFDETEFSNPQGTVVDGKYIYIADTDNHLIRRADLTNRTVQTIAGTGKQEYVRNPSGDAKNVGLNSPWDLTFNNGILYIAMAGSHQLWAIDLKTNKIRIHAGSGYENIVDSDLKSASLAQPSGITTDGKLLYFADSEVSAVRSADINLHNGKVNTIIGKGLFEFGDKDGKTNSARLQHPLGIVYVNGDLYVADTYNNKIKIINLDENTIKTLAGSGKEGINDGPFKSVKFNEPGGLDYANGILYIADTNNDLIRVIDLDSETVSTFALKGIEKLTRKELFEREKFKGDIVQISNVNLNRLRGIELKLSLPDGYKLNPLAPNHIKIYSPAGEQLSTEKIEKLKTKISFGHPFFQSRLYAEAVVYYCMEDNEGLCLIKDILFELNHSTENKNEGIEITYQVEK